MPAFVGNSLLYLSRQVSRRTSLLWSPIAAQKFASHHNSTAKCRDLHSSTTDKPLLSGRGAGVRRSSTTGHSGGISLNNRMYSTDNDTEASRALMVFRIPSPITWIRNKIFFFLIRSYFDPDFEITEFTEGANQAVVAISGSLADGSLDMLENLVSNEVLKSLQDKYKQFSVKQRQTFTIKPTDIVYSFPQNVNVDYDNSGRKWVSLLIQFWCLSDRPSQEHSTPKEIRSIDINLTTNPTDKRSIICVIYEFTREFTQGVSPEWTVTRIQHGDLTAPDDQPTI